MNTLSPSVRPPDRLTRVRNSLASSSPALLASIFAVATRHNDLTAIIGGIFWGGIVYLFAFLAVMVAGYAVAWVLGETIEESVQWWKGPTLTAAALAVVAVHLWGCTVEQH